MATQTAMCSDRRQAVRFPLDRAVHYRILGRGRLRKDRQGHGRTTDISSNGVRFTTSLRLYEGELVELSIHWPAHLENRIRLKLVITGQVVRNGDDTAAVAIGAYEFRTSRRIDWMQTAAVDPPGCLAHS